MMSATHEAAASYPEAFLPHNRQSTVSFMRIKSMMRRC